MSHPTGSRKRQTRRGSVLGLFVAVWLNLALVPCTMAMEAGDDHQGNHGCPHCPPAETHGHHDMHAGKQAQPSCADDLSDCGIDEDFSHDARGGQVQLKDAQTELPAFTAASDFVSGKLPHAHQRAPPLRSADRLPAGPPVHLLNCVFLD